MTNVLITQPILSISLARIEGLKSDFKAPKRVPLFIVQALVMGGGGASVAGLLNDRGNYNASTNLFPASGGSGTAGAVSRGDLWTVSITGTLSGNAVTAGDIVRALTDSPGQIAINWAVTETNFSYVPVASNVAIIGATKTKITYDAKGLVVSGADATTADIADTANKRYVSDANLVVINNTSGNNTGDQNISGKENISSKDASGGYAGLTLFKLNLRNAANTITSFFTTAAAVARTWTMPDKDGTVAMTSDITGTNSGVNTGDNAPIPTSQITQSGAIIGQAIVFTAGGWAPATLSASPGGASGGYQYNNAGAFAEVPGVSYASNTTTILSQLAAGIPLVIQAATSQTGELTEWRNSVGAAVAKVSPSGGATFSARSTLVGPGATTATADANTMAWVSMGSGVIALISAYGYLTLQIGGGGNASIRTQGGGLLDIEAAGGLRLSTTAGGGGLVYLRSLDNVLQLRNGVNGQGLELFNTYTDAINYEKASFKWSANILNVGVEALGTGVVRTMRLNRLKATTGAGTPSLGANCPAVNLTAPYRWIEVTVDDGSTAFIAAYK